MELPYWPSTMHQPSSMRMYRITLGLEGGTRFFQPFVVSFCGHNEKEHYYERQHGLLSMWRAYGKDVGYALVFERQKLSLACSRTNSAPIVTMLGAWQTPSTIRMRRIQTQFRISDRCNDKSNSRNYS